MSPTRTTEIAYAAAPAPSRTPVKLEPPIAVANTLGKLWPPLDLTDAVTVTWGSFSPLQSDTSTATGAHRVLAADGSTAAEENRGTPPLADRPSVSSVHMSQVREKRRWTWSTMRPAVGPWTMSAGPP